MTTLSDVFDVTEFSWIDPDSMHLVKKPANGVDSPLLAKAAESLDEVMEELTKQFAEGFCGDQACPVCKTRFTVLHEADPGFVEKAKLKAKDRKALPDSAFALPEKREYPIHDENHARAALSMLHNASPADQKRIKAAVHRRYPNIGDDNVTDDAKKTTASTSASEVQTHAVDAGPEGESSSPDNEDHGEPRHVAAEGDRPPESDGSGDTAPDKDLHQAEAEGQTHDNIEGNPAAKSEVDMTGDTPPDKDLHRSEAESQTHDNVEGNATKDAPGSPSWEHKDVALGEKAEALTNELKEVVTTFTEREKAEGGVTAKSRRIVSRVQKLLDNPALLRKVADNMSAVDVLKSLDEQDSARQAEETQKAESKAFDKAVKKAAKKLAKQMLADQQGEGGDTAKDSEESKAADETPDLSKLSQEELVAKITDLEKTVADIGAQDGRRPFISGAGAAAILRGPEAESVFKALDDAVADAKERLAKASSDIERSRAEGDLQAAQQRRMTAKLVAGDNARSRGQLPAGRFGPNSAELFKSGLSTLPDDTGLQYVSR